MVHSPPRTRSQVSPLPTPLKVSRSKKRPPEAEMHTPSPKRVRWSLPIVESVDGSPNSSVPLRAAPTRVADSTVHQEEVQTYYPEYSPTELKEADPALSEWESLPNEMWALVRETGKQSEHLVRKLKGVAVFHRFKTKKGVPHPVYFNERNLERIGTLKGGHRATVEKGWMLYELRPEQFCELGWEVVRSSATYQDLR